MLRTYAFPPGRVLACEAGGSYGELAGRAMPDVLIEDDCESSALARSPIGSYQETCGLASSRSSSPSSAASTTTPITRKPSSASSAQPDWPRLSRYRLVPGLIRHGKQIINGERIGPAASPAIFRDGICDHAIKELCRVYVSRSVKCEYCGNQRSEQARAHGLSEGQYDDLLNFEKSQRLSEREKAALAYAEAITWRLESSDELWDRLDEHFSEPELVELGCFIALTMGQQSWLRLLDIEHHEVMPGTAASLAPGFTTAQELAASKASPQYWAKSSTE